MSHTFYVFTRRGKPLGTLAAEDANNAQLTASAMHGAGAYVLPLSHSNWSERLMARVAQQAADKAEAGE
jgi:hypothetical protein